MISDLFGVDLEHGFGIVAVLAKDKFLDESVEHILQFGGVVRAVDDVAVVLEVKLGLRTQFTSKVLGWI